MNISLLCLTLLLQNPPDTGGQVLNRVKFLNSEISRLKLDKDEADGFRNQLKDIQGEVLAGRTLLGIYRLLDFEPDLMSESFTKSNMAASGSTRAFDAQWSKSGREIRTTSRALVASFPKMSSAGRALAQIAAIQADNYWVSGRLYGRNTKLEYGVQYLGLAEGLRGYSSFVREATGEEVEPISVGALDSELDTLNHEILVTLKNLGDKNRGKLIGVNSQYKLAFDLNKKGWREGALLAMARCQRGLTALQLGEQPPRAQIAQRISALGSKSKDTLTLLFSQIASQDLISTAPNSLKRAAVLTNQILPILARRSYGRVASMPKSAKVRITLVRWPYT